MDEEHEERPTRGETLGSGEELAEAA